jgi:hypothetical protein
MSLEISGIETGPTTPVELLAIAQDNLGAAFADLDDSLGTFWKDPDAETQGTVAAGAENVQARFQNCINTIRMLNDESDPESTSSLLSGLIARAEDQRSQVLDTHTCFSSLEFDFKNPKDLLPVTHETDSSVWLDLAARQHQARLCADLSQLVDHKIPGASIVLPEIPVPPTVPETSSGSSIFPSIFNIDTSTTENKAKVIGTAILAMGVIGLLLHKKP